MESEKVGLKLNIQKMKIITSGPITSSEIDGETVETVSDFIFLGEKSLSNRSDPLSSWGRWKQYWEGVKADAIFALSTGFSQCHLSYTTLGYKLVVPNVSLQSEE